MEMRLSRCRRRLFDQSDFDYAFIIIIFQPRSCHEHSRRGRLAGLEAKFDHGVIVDIYVYYSVGPYLDLQGALC